MDGIKRKPMNENPNPEVEIVRRTPITPEPRPDMHPLPPQDRISSNPFFKNSAPISRAPIVSTSSRAVMPSGKFFVWILGVLAVLGGGFVGANHFASATVEIVPLTETAKLDNDFTAVKDDQASALAFHFMSLSEEKEKEVAATIEQKVQKKASGKVVIYNAYSGQSQRLIKNTRLETPDHKIFRIDESVVVPGAKMSGTQVVAPGSVVAIVYADAPGKEYNIGLSDFTIPGFKGDPRYAKFTARSQSDSPIGGGFSGSVKVPSPEDVTAAQKELRDNLKTIAIEKARAQVPDGVTFFPGSMVVKFEDVPQEFSAEDTAKVIVRATVSVFFFDTDALVKTLAAEVLPQYAETPLELANKDTLSFTFVDPVDAVILSDLTRIRFHVSGDATFVGKIDSEKLTNDLAGKNKTTDFSTVLQTQSNIKKANATIFPMWNTVFPAAPEKISVKIVKE